MTRLSTINSTKGFSGLPPLKSVFIKIFKTIIVTLGTSSQEETQLRNRYVCPSPDLSNFYINTRLIPSFRCGKPSWDVGTTTRSVKRLSRLQYFSVSLRFKLYQNKVLSIFFLQNYTVRLKNYQLQLYNEVLGLFIRHNGWTKESRRSRRYYVVCVRIFSGTVRFSVLSLVSRNTPCT